MDGENWEEAKRCELESSTLGSGPTSPVGALRHEGACVELRQRRQLVETHVAIARNIARGFTRRYGWMLDPGDIEGWAMVGLCEAAARFDRARAEPFVAFAAQRIRGAIFDEIRRLGLHGRVINRRQRRISAAQRAISQTGGEPTDDRVAEHLGLSLAVVQSTIPQLSRVSGDEVGAVASLGASPEEYVECAQFLNHLRRAREALSEPDATVIRLHYEAGLSLAQVARILELTLGRVRHLHARGLACLHDTMRDEAAGGDAASLRDSVSYPSRYGLEATHEPK
jgi:RNA polymerase sigma factor FliA